MKPTLRNIQAGVNLLVEAKKRGARLDTPALPKNEARVFQGDVQHFTELRDHRFTTNVDRGAVLLQLQLMAIQHGIALDEVSPHGKPLENFAASLEALPKRIEELHEKRVESLL